MNRMLLLSIAVELAAVLLVAVVLAFALGTIFGLLPIAGYLLLVSAELRARRPRGKA